MDMDSSESLVIKLFDIGAVKFGEYILKSGAESPIYIDLREIISHPELLSNISKVMFARCHSILERCKCICGVPYTALPIATCVSVKRGIPMLLRRKEAKKYGTKKRLEGSYKEKDNCVIIEDVVTTGSSILETAEVLREEGLTVTDAVVFLDRDQCGIDNIKKSGITLHRVYMLDDMIKTLCKFEKIDVSKAFQLLAYIETSREMVTSPKTSALKKMPFSSRKNLGPIHNVTKLLFGIIDEKKTNLCVAADVTSCSKLLEIADAVGPHICILKTHVDILVDFNNEFITALQNLSQKHKFLIFEDRKFADIGKTVQLQYTQGIYKIQVWSNIINAHALPGPGIISALKQASASHNACLLIAEMSSEGNLASPEYVRDTKKIAETHKDFVMGFISQSMVFQDSPAFVQMTPGVKFCKDGDQLGQQYVTPEDAVTKRGADVIIVGRGITEADNPVEMATKYKEAAYSAYMSLA